MAEIGCAGVSRIRYSFLGYAYDTGIGHRPLRDAANALVQAILIGVIPTISVSEEERINAASLQELCKIYPVVELPLLRGFVARVLSKVLLASSHIALPIIGLPSTALVTDVRL